ncbi:MAG: ROK family transcriptional regulator [Bacteroidales bacterium]|nr:ROK family transcriptional regulator [Bacteroidales bacterium]
MNKYFLSDKDSKNASLKRQIIKLCIEAGSYSIAELSSRINSSVPTVTKLINELITEGFLQDLGKQGTTGGRRPSIFGLNPKAGYFVGVDIARQHFHIAICDFKGELVDFIQDIEFVLEDNPASFSKLCKYIRESVIKTGLSWDDVLSVGVSLSGRVNPEKGYSLTYFVSEKIPLKDFFEEELDVPVYIENDSRAMTYGEYMSSVQGSEKNMIFVNISWGLGMGMILDGRLYYGTSGFSGEIGHFPILSNDRICRCGKVGCLETGASGSALHDMIVNRLKEGRVSSLTKKYELEHDISLEDILKAVDEEDVLAIDSMGRIGEILGRGIAGIINIFNPGQVIIGGRLIVGGDYLMFPIRTAVNKYSLNRVSSDTSIRFSKLGRKAASVGDCLLSRAKLLGLPL